MEGVPVLGFIQGATRQGGDGTLDKRLILSRRESWGGLKILAGENATQQIMFQNDVHPRVTKSMSL